MTVTYPVHRNHKFYLTLYPTTQDGLYPTLLIIELTIPPIASSDYQRLTTTVWFARTRGGALSHLTAFVRGYDLRNRSLAPPAAVELIELHVVTETQEFHTRPNNVSCLVE